MDEYSDDYDYDIVSDGMMNYALDRGKNKEFHKAWQDLIEKRKDLNERGFKAFKTWKDQYGVTHTKYRRKKKKID